MNKGTRKQSCILCLQQSWAAPHYSQTPFLFLINLNAKDSKASLLLIKCLKNKLVPNPEYCSFSPADP